MVYCGKPSKGCLACRSRKTRCDRAVPSCSQCVRAKRECPGYRNQLDLMFRNESQTVIGKVTTRKIRKPKAAPSPAKSPPRSPPVSYVLELKTPDSNEGGEDFNLPLLLQQNYVPNSISPSIQDRALSFYKNREAIWLRNFDLVETICDQTSADEYLLASLSAVGLASYAASVRSPGLMIKARRDYGRALKLTNDALKSPIEFTKDSTLFAVISLGVFEAVAGNGEESLKAWAKHLAGASELVKLRGPAQFRTEAGQRMFFQISSNLMVHCVLHGKPMPSHIVALRAGAAPYIDTQEPAWRISETIIQFTSLRQNAVEKLLDPRALVQGALDIEQEFLDILEKMPPEWHPKTYYNNECPEAVWKGTFTIFNDFWMAQMHNTLRAFRIHAHQILREQLAALSPDLKPIFSERESTEMLAKSIRVMLEMQGQILSNIPQYAPWGISSFPSSSPIEPWRAYHVLWPLFLVGNMDITAPGVQEWVLNRFRVMGKAGGIEHANVLADSMSNRQEEMIWDGNDEREYSRPLQMSPLAWDIDGWAIAHGIILSGQINRTTTAAANPPRMPPPGMRGPPPGWTGPPPPGWNGQLPPSSLKSSSSGSSPSSVGLSPSSGTSVSSGFSGGPPPGWTGPPPPGWTGPPPPGWKGPPPPGWKGQMPPAITGPNASPNDVNMPPKPLGRPSDFSKGPPPGWTGPPPPGWNGQMPPAITGPPSSSKGVNMPPTDFSRGPPPGWVGPPPPGWNGGLPPNFPAEKVSVPPTARNGGSEFLTGPPDGWVGPPPPGWNGQSLPPSSSESINIPQSASKITTAGSSSFIPQGWSGPPPPGWQPPPGFIGPPGTPSASSGTPAKSKKKGHSSKGSKSGKKVAV